MNDDGDDEEVEMVELAMESGWIADAPQHVQDSAKELLHQFSLASLYLSGVGERVPNHQHDGGECQLEGILRRDMESATMLVAVADTIHGAILRIGLIESIKKTTNMGMDLDILRDVGRSVLSALLLAGIRYGQEHPNAFLQGVEESDLASELERVLAGLANDQSSEGDDKK